jgi:diaminobutyrate-2-oxoglutarate transaminase
MDATQQTVQALENLESKVRSYGRTFPAVFSSAQGAFLFDHGGKRYIDFLSGAGALNYGHNNPMIKRAVQDYLSEDGIVHGLDLGTIAKLSFMERFASVILKPRGLKFRFQFTGPTGANGVEAALKLARLVTGRRNVVSFTGGYHGLSAGALAVTSNSFYRSEKYVNRADVSFLPYDGYFGTTNTIPLIRKMLSDPSSGIDHPAAVIVEAVQCEGGVNVASSGWLQSLQEICREREILLILDDVQTGSGRTGHFFGFERAGLDPDMVVLSKSISGLGLPMTLVLLKETLDIWEPGQHSGTFRGNNLALVAATAALSFWENDSFAKEILRKGRHIQDCLKAFQRRTSGLVRSVRGCGMVVGADLGDSSYAAAVQRAGFERGLIFELCGAQNTVAKIMPPLIISDATLDEGLGMLFQSLSNCG